MLCHDNSSSMPWQYAFASLLQLYSHYQISWEKKSHNMISTSTIALLIINSNRRSQQEDLKRREIEKRKERKREQQTKQQCSKRRDHNYHTCSIWPKGYYLSHNGDTMCTCHMERQSHFILRVSFKEVQFVAIEIFSTQ